MSENYVSTKFGRGINYLKNYQLWLHGSIIIIILFIDYQIFNPILPISNINIIIIAIASFTYLSIYVNRLLIKKKQKNQPHITCPKCNSNMVTSGAWNCTNCPGIFDPHNIGHSSKKQTSKMTESMTILKNRLVKGEITEEKFLKLKKLIEN